MELTAEKFRTRDLAYIAVSVALMAVCSWIAIPTVIPFTLQTMALFLTLGLLGGRRGTLAVAAYILLGAVGAPVFAEFSGGIGVLLRSTGGYIVGFFFTALLMWSLEKVLGRDLPALGLSMVLGMVVYYIFGTAWFMVLYTRDTGAISLFTALSWCVFPFIIPDLVKIALALSLVSQLRRHVR